MKLKVNQNIFQAIPGLEYTALLFKNANNQRKSSNVSQLLRGTSVVIKNEAKRPAKKAYLEMVENLDLGNGQTLLEPYLLNFRIKKLQNKQDIEGNTNLTNLCYYLAFKYFLPLQGLDLDSLETDFEIELYEPKKGKKAPELEFGTSTRHFVIWFPQLEKFEEEKLDLIIKEIEQIIKKYVGADLAEVFHLDNENQVVDLGYVSDKERAYAEAHPEIFDEEMAAEPKYNLFNNAGLNDQVYEDGKMENWPINLSEMNRKFKIADQIRELMVLALQKTCREDFAELAGEILDPEGLVEIETPKDAANGDFSCNLAMKLTKIFRKTPLEIAQKLLNHLPQSQILEKVDLAAPGFINFRLSIAHLQTLLDELLSAQQAFGHADYAAGKQVLVDFGSLNVAKPFGVHHFMTTVLGQTTVNLLKAVGYQVIAADYPGDWGTQFGKVIFAYKNWGNREVIEKDPIRELLALYVKFHEEAEKNGELENLARAENAKLEAGDEENRELWQWMCEISMQESDKVYRTLGVHFDERHSESEYVEAGKAHLEKWKAEKKIVEGEKGAWVVKLEEEKLADYLVQKSDGTTIYATRDLALIIDRLVRHPQLHKIIYVVDSAQSLHFRQLFAVARRWNLAPATLLYHLAYGRMSFPEGGMSTRKGKILWASDVINEAIERASKLVLEKSANLPLAEQKKIAQALAIGAIKHAIVNQAPETDFSFDWDKVMTFDGNSAPYLQYTLARALSIINKANDQANKGQKVEDQISLFTISEEQKALEEANLKPFQNHYENNLLKALIKFPERVEAAAANLKPNYLTNYLYDLAQTFNSFYQAVPVLKTQNEELLAARMRLVQGFGIVMRNGLSILGITPLERM